MANPNFADLTFTTINEVVPAGSPLAYPYTPTVDPLSPVGQMTSPVQNSSTLVLSGSLPTSSINESPATIDAIQTLTPGGVKYAAYLSGVHPQVGHVCSGITIYSIQPNSNTPVAAAMLVGPQGGGATWIAAWFSYAGTGTYTAYLEAWINGVQTYIFPTAISGSIATTDRINLRLVIVNGFASVWYQINGGTWYAGKTPSTNLVLWLDVSAVDWSDPAVLAQWQYAYGGGGSSGSGAGVVKLSNFVYGYAAPQGISDHFVVTRKNAVHSARNGAEYMTDNATTYFTWDNAMKDKVAGGTLDGNVQFRHMAIGNYNSVTREWTETAKLFYVSGGKIYSMQDGEIVFDEDRNVFTGTTMSWTETTHTGGIKCYYWEAPASLMNGGIQIITPIRVANLTKWNNGAGVSIYDVSRRYDISNARWMWAYTYTNALAATSITASAPAYDYSADQITFTNVSAKTITTGNYEGTKWVQCNGVQKIASVTPAPAFQLYNPSDMSNFATLTVPAIVTLVAHPTMYSAPSSTGTVYRIATFDATVYTLSSNYCIGNAFMLEATPQSTAAEFDWTPTDLTDATTGNIKLNKVIAGVIGTLPAGGGGGGTHGGSANCPFFG